MSVRECAYGPPPTGCCHYWQKTRHSMGTDFLQELDLHASFKDVSGEYIVTVNVPEKAPYAIDRAMRIAIDRQTVTTVFVSASKVRVDRITDKLSSFGEKLLCTSLSHEDEARLKRALKSDG